MCKGVVGVGVEAVIDGPDDHTAKLVQTAPGLLELALWGEPNAPIPTPAVLELPDAFELSALSMKAYQAALSRVGVSVVRTIRRDAA